MFRCGELAVREHGGLLFICESTLILKLLFLWPPFWYAAAELLICSSPSEPPETISKLVLIFIRFLLAMGIAVRSYTDEFLLWFDIFLIRDESFG